MDRVRFRGASLEGNALGDPAERELIVYLPPSYGAVEGTQGEAVGRRYPVVMVLAGYAATSTSLLNFKPWEPNLLERYEHLLAQGAAQEAIVVLPDCFTRLGGSQYLDAPAVGDYQRYLADDVLGLVDARYRTLARRTSRAIIGKSSGGFGALRMGIDRPEAFAVIGSHAGDCAFELSIRPRFVEVAPVYERHGGAAGFLRAVEMQGGPRSQAEFHALEILALAHVYADGELPFDPYTALVVPDKWARWLAHDPLFRDGSTALRDQANSGQPLHSLQQARLVFLDAGKSDEYGLQFGARMLAQRLRELGVAVDHEEFEGGHMGTAYRYDVSLPKIIAALDLSWPTQGGPQPDAPSTVRSRAEEPRASTLSSVPPEEPARSAQSSGTSGARASRTPL
ncbi:MAG: alpha/beta hydrolase-fold protein [Polyangiales bacterium]